jgi:hypothetical protein
MYAVIGGHTERVLQQLYQDSYVVFGCGFKGRSVV